jgi:hypothetical protein
MNKFKFALKIARILAEDKEMLTRERPKWLTHQ